MVLCSAGSGCSMVVMMTPSEAPTLAPSLSQVKVGDGSPRTLIWKVVILLSFTIREPPLPLSMARDRFLYLQR